MPCYAYGASRQKNDRFLVTFIQYVIMSKLLIRQNDIPNSKVQVNKQAKK